MTKHKQAHAPALARLERRTQRPATAFTDVLVLTGAFFLLVYLAAYCLTHNMVELGVAVSAALPWFLYRVVVWDGSREQEHFLREYHKPTAQEPRTRPITITTTPGGYQMKYGQLYATQSQYADLLQNIQRHPRQKLTRGAIPAGLIENVTERYPAFVKEMTRLGWVNGGQVLTPAGFHALTRLAEGHAPTDD